MTVARTIALRSLCSRDRVGAVIVTAENRIVDTGYNGPPRGMHRDELTDCRSWCPRAQSQLPDCGNSEIHPPHKHCVGWPAMAYAQRLRPGYEDAVELHAEANALMFSDRRAREGGTIYVTSGTCSACAKLVANSGLARAVYGRRSDGASHRDSERWYDFMRGCGLEVVTYAGISSDTLAS